MRKPACRFYGYHAAIGYLIPSGGNQCAMVTNAFAPCLFDIENKSPDWANCSRNDHSAHARLIFTYELLEKPQ